MMGAERARRHLLPARAFRESSSRSRAMWCCIGGGDSHALLYRVLWRITHGEHDLLDDAVDPDVRQLVLRSAHVRRDEHKMHAFVRFREVDGHFVAWYAPDHFVVHRAAEFFRERFHGMKWTILGPDESVSWDGVALTFGPSVPRHSAPPPDELDGVWRTYYASIFNPARANPTVMRQHMPARSGRSSRNQTSFPAYSRARSLAWTR